MTVEVSNAQAIALQMVAVHKEHLAAAAALVEDHDEQTKALRDLQKSAFQALVDQYVDAGGVVEDLHPWVLGIIGP